VNCYDATLHDEALFDGLSNVTPSFPDTYCIAFLVEFISSSPAILQSVTIHVRSNLDQSPDPSDFEIFVSPSKSVYTVPETALGVDVSGFFYRRMNTHLPLIFINPDAYQCNKSSEPINKLFTLTVLNGVEPCVSQSNTNNVIPITVPILGVSTPSVPVALPMVEVSGVASLPVNLPGINVSGTGNLGVAMPEVTANGALTTAIAGVAIINNSLSTTIEGVTTNMGAINTNIAGATTTNEGALNIKIQGTSTTNNALDTNITGTTTTNNALNTNISGAATANGALNTNISGAATANGALNTNISGAATANGALNTNIQGASTSDGGLNANLLGTTTSDGALNANLKGVGVFQSGGSGFLQVITSDPINSTNTKPNHYRIIAIGGQIYLKNVATVAGCFNVNLSGEFVVTLTSMCNYFRITVTGQTNSFYYDVQCNSFVGSNGFVSLGVLRYRVPETVFPFLLCVSDCDNHTYIDNTVFGLIALK